MRRVLPLKIALASLLIAACVTINVYFPAAAADKAADQVIDNITKGSGSTTPPQGFRAPHSSGDVLLAAVGNVVYAMIPAAQAQGAETLDVSSPAITRITASMQGRWGELEKFFASGAIGLTNNGNIEVRDLNAVALPDRATVKRLVSEDNADRAQLYSEIAKANNHPEWEADVRKSFARRWVAKAAKPGWYYQDDSGAWKQK
ncbi:MAG TPA: YdbL family protein [Steroidobacteraceae bacterium]